MEPRPLSGRKPLLDQKIPEIEEEEELNPLTSTVKTLKGLFSEEARPQLVTGLATLAEAITGGREDAFGTILAKGARSIQEAISYNKALQAAKAGEAPPAGHMQILSPRLQSAITQERLAQAELDQRLLALEQRKREFADYMSPYESMQLRLTEIMETEGIRFRNKLKLAEQSLDFGLRSLQEEYRLRAKEQGRELDYKTMLKEKDYQIEANRLEWNYFSTAVSAAIESGSTVELSDMIRSLVVAGKLDKSYLDQVERLTGFDETKEGQVERDFIERTRKKYETLYKETQRVPSAKAEAPGEEVDVEEQADVEAEPAKKDFREFKPLEVIHEKLKAPSESDFISYVTMDLPPVENIRDKEAVYYLNLYKTYQEQGRKQGYSKSLARNLRRVYKALQKRGVFK